MADNDPRKAAAMPAKDQKVTPVRLPISPQSPPMTAPVSQIRGSAFLNFPSTNGSMGAAIPGTKNEYPVKSHRMMSPEIQTQLADASPITTVQSRTAVTRFFPKRSFSMMPAAESSTVSADPDNALTKARARTAEMTLGIGESAASQSAIG